MATRHRYIRGWDRRHDKRRTVPQLRVTIGAQSFETGDWSLGGLSLQHFDEWIEPGTEQDVIISCDFRGRSVRLTAKIKYVRWDPINRVAAATFIAFRANAFDRLQDISINRR